MAKPNVRNTREVEKRSVDTNTSADDKKTKDCLLVNKSVCIVATS